jgi:hypothetical protein
MGIIVQLDGKNPNLALSKRKLAMLKLVRLLKEGSPR